MARGGRWTHPIDEMPVLPARRCGLGYGMQHDETPEWFYGLVSLWLVVAMVRALLDAIMSFHAGT